jgi:hypothetical protein
MGHSYSLLPFDSVPATPSYKAWFAAWSNDRSKLDWTATRPSTAPDSSAAWVICVSDGEGVPPGAKILAKGLKDVPPPPLLATAIASKGLEQAFREAFDSNVARDYRPS